MKFEAVTTFSKEGKALYGDRMLRTFVDFWPNEVGLTVYADGWESWSSPDLYKRSPWLNQFKYRHKDRKFRDFRMDAVKFAHKVAAVTDAALSTDADVLIWLDGDIITHAPVTIPDLEKLAPVGEEWIAWLDRTMMYPECGFYMLNCRHERHTEMVTRFLAMYVEDRLFALPEWHDSYVLQHVVETSGIRTKSLSGEGRSTTHPLVNGPLGRWWDHLKGPRKADGKSRPGDLVRPRGEDYWK